MNTKNTTKTFVIALAMTLALAIVPTMAFGQSFGHGNINPFQNNDLVGVWQSVSPTVDCQTGVPNGPPIKVLFNFMQGGTMSLSDTNEIDGPYRSPLEGIWRRISGRNYAYVGLYYAFNPDRTFAATIKLRENITLGFGGNITLGHNSNSFTGNGTFEVFDPNDNFLVSGCFTDSGTRLTF